MICHSCKKETDFGKCFHCGKWNDSCVLLTTPFVFNKRIFQEIQENMKKTIREEELKLKHTYEYVLNSLQKDINDE